MRFFADAAAKQAGAGPPAPAVGALPLAITIGTAFDARTITSKALHVAPSGQETITMSPSVHEVSAQALWMSRDAASRPKVVLLPRPSTNRRVTALRNDQHHRKA